MASFSSIVLTVLKICTFKIQKTTFFKENFPLMKFPKVGTKHLNSEFLSSYFAVSLEALDRNSLMTSFWKSNLYMQILRKKKIENSKEIRGLGRSFPKLP